MRDDSLAAAGDRASHDHALRQVVGEGDVDSLSPRVRAGVDRAIADLDVAAADVDAVELRARHRHAVEHDVSRLVDLDSVLAADDGDVADRDAVRANNDAAANDGALLAD